MRCVRCQVGAYVAIRLDRDAIRALQLDISAHTVRDAIVASRLRVRAPQITCAPPARPWDGHARPCG